MSLLQACLNGGRDRAAHRAVPRTPDELAAAATAAAAAGATAFHVHPRGADGRESLDGEVVGAAVRAIRAAAPGVPVGVTTGAWIERDPARRQELVAGWRERPDYASVNLCEPGAVELCATLLRRGIGVEAGVWTPADVATFLDAKLAGRVVRVMLEAMEPELRAARANVAAMLSALDAAKVKTARLVHGQHATTWPLLEDAVARGDQIRIGLEDVLLLPDGSPARDNAELVAAAARIRRTESRTVRDVAGELGD